MAIIKHMAIITEGEPRCNIFKDDILEELIKRFDYIIYNHKCNKPYEDIIKARILSAIKDNLINLKIYYERDENGRNQFG